MGSQYGLTNRSRPGERDLRQSLCGGRIARRQVPNPVRLVPASGHVVPQRRSDYFSRHDGIMASASWAGTTYRATTSCTPRLTEKGQRVYRLCPSLGGAGTHLREF